MGSLSRNLCLKKKKTEGSKNLQRLVGEYNDLSSEERIARMKSKSLLIRCEHISSCEMYALYLYVSFIGE